jgi:hypothetical protein
VKLYFDTVSSIQHGAVSCIHQVERLKLKIPGIEARTLVPSHSFTPSHDEHRSYSFWRTARKKAEYS